MKRVILTGAFSKGYVVITKGLENDCYVNNRRVDNIGIYELINTYKKLGCKIDKYTMGTVKYWGNICDMNDLASFKTIYEIYEM
jgi:hypothetical protein